MVRLWPGEAGGGKGRCVGSLWVTLGSLYRVAGLSCPEAGVYKNEIKVQKSHPEKRLDFRICSKKSFSDLQYFGLFVHNFLQNHLNVNS